MKTKFKVGDKVQIVFPDSDEYGRIGIITSIDKGGTKYIDNQEFGWVYDSSLELISHPNAQLMMFEL